ncbi:MAG: hypothetical protein V3T86_08220 [Planctomycetota bacterium]
MRRTNFNPQGLGKPMQLALASALAVVLLPALAFGDAFERKAAGLNVEAPDGWSRDTTVDGSTVIYAADAEIADGKTFRLTIEVESAIEFDPEKWAEEQQKLVEEELTTILTKFTLVRTRTFKGDGDEEVGSHGYEISGVDEDDVQIRHRVAAVINGGNVFIVHEIAKGDAEGANGELADKMMEGIRFPSPVPPKLDLSLPEDAEPTPVEDKDGNLKVTLPPGWAIPNDVNPVEGAPTRFTAIRTNSSGNDVAVVTFYRFTGFNASIFAEEGPTQFLTDRTKPLMENFFGHTNELDFDSDESELLPGIEKASRWTVTSRKKEEWEAIRRIQEHANKGVKLSIPDPPMYTLYGRVGMLSPNVYMIILREVANRQSSDESLLAEFRTMNESFELISGTAKLPPLRVGNMTFANTKDDPANAKDRKGKHLVEVFSKTRRDKEPSAVIELRYIIPAGFIRVSELENGALKLFLVAQDQDNNNVVIRFIASHRTELPARTKFQDVKNLYQQWSSKWESQARGSGRIKPKPDKITLGRIGSAKGMRYTGIIDGFSASRRNFVTDKKGWRIELEITSRGDGIKAFEAPIKTFVKKIGFRKK